MSSNITHIDFKYKKRTKAFVVNPQRDKNEILRNELIRLEQFYRDKKWEIPPGPDCRINEDLRALAYYTGFFHRDDVGRAMAKILYHTEKCERCDAIVFKTIMDYYNMENILKKRSPKSHPND